MTVGRGRIRRGSLLAACSLLTMAPAAAWAQPAPASSIDYDIRAQNLGTALVDLARRSNRDIYFPADLVRGKRAARLRGRFTVTEALQRLLSGTGLEYTIGDEGSIVVREDGTPRAVLSNDRSVETAPADYERGISEILVIGRRTQNIDVRRTEDDPQPYQVFTKEEIQRSQATTLEDFFRTRLTTNTAAGSEAQRTSSVIGNGAGSSRSAINLRGLGSNQTLILVDGRRLGDLSIQNPNDPFLFTGSGQPDINGIPLASIERIEVLSSTAGGIYGGNAVGGVINIILRRDYRGLELTANYQDTEDFAYPIHRLDVAGGLALEGGKTNITFSGSISRAGVLRVGERDFSRRAFARGLANAPEQFFEKTATGVRINLTPVARGVNVESFSGGPLTFKPEFGGGALGATFTNVPVGFSGTPTQLAAALRANAGNFNFEEPLGNNGTQRSLMTAPELQSFSVNVRRKFADWLDIYADYSKFVNKGSAFASNQPPSQISLQPSSPANPFNERIFVVFDNQNLATPSKSKFDTNRATLGFSLRLPHNWAAGFDYTWNWSHQTSSFYNIPIDLAGRTCAQIGVAPANVGPLCPAPFGNPADTRPAVNVLLNPDFSEYALTQPTDAADLRTTLWTPTLRVAGPLFRLPGGPVNFTGQLQRNIARQNRGETYNATFLNRNDPTPFGQTFRAFAPSRQVNDSVYGELTVPLFGDRNATTMLRELSVQASIRHDTYETTQARVAVGTSSISRALAIANLTGMSQTAENDATNYTVAVRYSPIDDIAFRASYGTGFTQPTVNQVVTNSQTINPGGFFRIFDGLRGNTVQTTPFQLVSGGVFEFEPEHSKSLSVGAIVTPRFLPGFRFSADYSLTKKRNEITTVNLTDLLNNPDLFPGRVIRAPLTPADAAKGYTGGEFISINTAQINLFRSRVSSYDFQADYDFKVGGLGDIHLYGAATYQPELKRQLSATQSFVNRAGFADGNVKWRGNGGVTLRTGPFVFQYNAQYYDSYIVYNSNDSQFLIDRVVKLQGSKRIPSQFYQDVFVSYNVPAESGLLNGLTLSLGVQNVFDRSPPIVATTFYSVGGYSGYGDPRMRRFSLTLRKAFGQ